MGILWEMEGTDRRDFVALADGRVVDTSTRVDEKLVAATQEMENAAAQVLWLNDILRSNLYVDDTGLVKPITSISQYQSMHSAMASLQFKLIDAKRDVLKAMSVHGLHAGE